MKAKYRKKAKPFYAVQWNGDNIDEVVGFLIENGVEPKSIFRNIVDGEDVIYVKIDYDFFLTIELSNFIYVNLSVVDTQSKDGFLASYELVEGGDEA